MPAPYFCSIMTEERSLNFLEEIIENDLAAGKYPEGIKTRFPPEPNGYLHIGHAMAIHTSFGLAKKYGGTCALRFDDTNPLTEETEYVESIQEDIKWLGYTWDSLHFTSDYFEQLHAFAIKLIRDGKAYVDDSTAEEIAAQKGSLTSPGTASEFRNRSVEENLQLFAEMKEGNYADGTKVLRAKIDMTHPNLLLRDPIIYRIKHATHHRTGDAWCIYPMYDFAHGQSDSIEHITHSICTLEFIHHRPLYDWFIRELDIYPSHQYEFARLNLNYTVMSKRKLLQLVNEKKVSGWDDPRMPTISGMRRRGYTPHSLRKFCETAGLARRDKVNEIGLLEFCVREDLNKTTHRVMAVLDPVKLIISNYPEGGKEELEAENNPEDEQAGSRMLPFSKELWIEREDFMEDAPKKFFRLALGLSVRLKHAYIVTCTGFDKDEKGKVTAVHCNYHPDSKSGNDTSGISVKGTIHWVNAADCGEAEVRLYDRLLKVENPTLEEGDFKDHLNENSLEIITAKIEPSLLQAEAGEKFQFMRKGYFCADKNSKPGAPVFNRTVGLKDSWTKSGKK